MLSIAVDGACHMTAQKSDIILQLIQALQANNCSTSATQIFPYAKILIDLQNFQRFDAFSEI